MNTPLDDPASIAAIWQLNRHQDITDTATANGRQESEEPPAVEQQPTTAATPVEDTATEAITGPSSDSDTSTPEPVSQPCEDRPARAPPKTPHTGRHAVLSMSKQSRRVMPSLSPLQAPQHPTSAPTSTGTSARPAPVPQRKSIPVCAGDRAGAGRAGQGWVTKGLAATHRSKQKSKPITDKSEMTGLADLDMPGRVGTGREHTSKQTALAGFRQGKNEEYQN